MFDPTTYILAQRRARNLSAPLAFSDPSGNIDALTVPGALTEVGQDIANMSDYVTVPGAGTGDDTYTCNIAGAREKNFALAIADTDAKVIVLSNVPAGRCEVFLEITASATAAVTWTLNGGTVAWMLSIAPVLTAGYIHRIMLITNDGGATWDGYSLGGVA